MSHYKGLVLPPVMLAAALGSGCGLITIKTSSGGPPTPKPYESVGQSPLAASSEGPVSPPSADGSAPVSLAPQLAPKSQLASANDQRALYAAREKELPSVEKVRQLIQGANPADTSARQRAAFWVLRDYTDSIAFSGKDISWQYQRATGVTINEPLGSDAWAYARSPDFSADVVSKTVSPQALVTYQQTQNWAALKAREARRVADKPLNDALAKDVAAAKRDHVELTVFGVELGEPLEFPKCEAGQPRQSETCVLQQDGWDALETNLFVTGRLAPPGGMVNVPLVLGQGKCPGWVDCSTLVVTTLRGVAMAAYFQTSLSAEGQAQVADKLSAKYHRSPVPSGSSNCTLSYNGVKLGAIDQAKNLLWSMDALQVFYSPFGNISNCNQGLVEVKTTAYLRIISQAQQRHEAAEPKM